MLKSLSVENYALIDRLELNLSESLNIITGETGAGKSILLGALGLLMGARGDAGVLRDEGRNCVVEGVFNLAGYALEDFFEENDLDYDEFVTIRRVVAPTGKSRAYINDLPVQLTTLKELTIRLLDIHSQHQSLMLAQEAFRVSIVDAVAGSAGVLAEYAMAYSALRAAEKQLADTQALNVRDSQEKEWLEHQVEVLTDAKLVAGEEALLEAEQEELAHAEEIKSVLAENAARLDGENSSIVAQMKSAAQSLSALARFYPRAEELAARFDTSYIELRDLQHELAAQADRLESNPARLAHIDDRLSLLYSLRQKYRAESLAQLIDIQASYAEKLLAINTSGEAIEALSRDVQARGEAAAKLASELSALREKAAPRVAEYVEKTAAQLGMPAAKFVVEVATVAMRPSGANEIKFLFSANKNVPPAPVEKIASGGETSRIMLSLKALAARNSNLPTIIFDEIDTGVSGSVADAMGSIIEQLSHGMQVVDITHLPQVASKGEAHFVVSKDAESRTTIRRLSPDERVEEIAKMLSGQAVTDAARAQARLLLKR